MRQEFRVIVAEFTTWLNEELMVLRITIRIALHLNPKVGALAHSAHDPLHNAYLLGVAFGGGYRYVAMGLLLCGLFAWLCNEDH